MNLLFVVECDKGELDILLKIQNKKQSECDRVDFLNEHIAETEIKIQ